MSKGRWGESFLKSGLPLEHLAAVTFKGPGWECQTGIEYLRLNREGEKVWYELDLAATNYKKNKDTYLSFLVECKYHDLSRFWFFLPHTKDRWYFDDRVLNCGPIQTLTEPKVGGLLKIAPLSAGGIVVSEDGVKQDNAVHTAIHQLSSGFIPYCLQEFSCNLNFDNYTSNELDFIPVTTAVIPMIITNARIFRLKPTVSDLDVIRDATEPKDIADEIDWTWCYHEGSRETYANNFRAIEKRKEVEAAFFYRFPFVSKRLEEFVTRPNWIAIVNIKSLDEVIEKIDKYFRSIKTTSIKELLKPKNKTNKSKP